jgi:hypothetical protein
MHGGLTAALVLLVSVIGVSVGSCSDDIGRAGAAVPDTPPKPPKPPAVLPEAPNIPPRVPGIIVRGHYPTQPEWLESFTSTLEEYGPDVVDYLPDILEAMASTKCTLKPVHPLGAARSQVSMLMTSNADQRGVPAPFVDPMIDRVQATWVASDVDCTPSP